jgi:hypothetical protein
MALHADLPSGLASTGIGPLKIPNRTIFPDGNLTAITAPTMGSMSFQYLPVAGAFSASRVDVLVGMSVASTASAVTYGLVITAIAGIYSNSASTLNSLSTGSTTVSFSVASNTAGQTQLNQAAVRAISVPMNVSFNPGEYFVAFVLSTNTSSIGAATTALGQTLSMYGGNQLQTASNIAVEFTNATATSGGLYAGMGVHSVAQNAASATYAVSDINATGSALSAANIALIFRNV